MIGVIIYGNSNKHTSVIYVLEWFLMWIQWWCPFYDQSDHTWQDWQTHKCYIWSGAVFYANLMVMSILWLKRDHIWQCWQTNKCYIFSETVFWCESNDGVHSVIRVSIYSIQDKEVSQDNVKAKIQDKKFFKTMSRLRSKTKKFEF